MLSRKNGPEALEGFFWRQVEARSPQTRVKATPYDDAGEGLRHLEGVLEVRSGSGVYVASVGAKGCVTVKPERVRDFRDFLGVDDRYSPAHWLVQHNGEAFLPPWAKAEQWLLSARHDQAAIDLFAENFRTFVAPVSR